MSVSSIAVTAPGRLQKLALYLVAFLAGFVTMALEMLIGRTFIPFFGGTIYTWGALISVFLAGMTIGYVAGGRAADRHPATHVVAILAILAAAAVMVVPVWGDDIINAILDTVEDMRYAALLAALLLACIPAALLAAIAPFCLRLLMVDKDKSGTVSGRLSGLATTGSIAGTLGTSFVLIPAVGVKAIYGFIGGATLLVGLLFLSFGLRGRMNRRQWRLDAAVVALLAGIAGLGLASPRQSFAAQAAVLMMRDGPIEKVDSEYNSIIVEKQGTLLKLNFGYRTNQYTESIMDLADPGGLATAYSRHMSAALVYRSGPVRRLALIGLGGGSTIGYMVASLPGVVADAAELDGAVIRLADKYFGVRSNGRLRIHESDGRIFLKRADERFDAILLDAYRGPFVPFHLTTREFYQLVKSKLSPGGVVAQNVDPATLLFDSTYRTMKTVFDQVDAFQSEEGNIVLVAYSGPRLSTQELAERAARTQEQLRLKYDLRELVKSRRDFAVSSAAKLLTDDFAPVEMLKTVKRMNEKRI